MDRDITTLAAMTRALLMTGRDCPEFHAACPAAASLAGRAAQRGPRQAAGTRDPAYCPVPLAGWMFWLPWNVLPGS
jgi:hypothetical protein